MIICGFAGFLLNDAPAQSVVAEQMGAALQHRGPDASGSWADAEHGYAVAFRRLAIIDISENGNQPMISPSGRYVIAFNGEIYNHRAIRRQLETIDNPHNWQGHCDTEVLLVAIEKWGVQKTLEDLDGMFAFALWDRQECRLILARDRFGEKPLYYGRVGNAICFGSELKALAKYPGWHGAINRNVAALFLQYGYVPDPYCIFEGIQKLPPSHFVEIRRNATRCVPVCYWSLKNVVEGPRRHSSEDFLLEELHEHLKKSVRSRMEADVPLGALLSGGIDSSLIVALM
ncbi:MAG: asparagine synthase (glutamine-hydrolyzing), partial [Pirellulales bacterium]